MYVHWIKNDFTCLLRVDRHQYVLYESEDLWFRKLCGFYSSQLLTGSISCHFHTCEDSQKKNPLHHFLLLLLDEARVESSIHHFWRNNQREIPSVSKVVVSQSHGWLRGTSRKRFLLAGWENQLPLIRVHRLHLPVNGYVTLQSGTSTEQGSECVFFNHHNFIPVWGGEGGGWGVGGVTQVNPKQIK